MRPLVRLLYLGVGPELKAMALKALAVSHKAVAWSRGLGRRIQELVTASAASAATNGAVVGRDEKGKEGKQKETAAAAAAAAVAVDRTVAGTVSMEHVDVVAPDGTLLIHDLSFRVVEHESLLIVGANGSGKSSLLRVLAGVWPCRATAGAAGRSSMSLPPREQCFFMPQRPYIARGSLRQQLVYPKLYVDGAGDASCVKSFVSSAAG